jgi:TPR repeat protein
MKRFPSAVLKYISGLFSPRAAAPKGVAVSGKFQEYETKAEKGDAEAQFNLGFCYDDGRGVKKDYAEAVKWYRKAAEQNFAPAQFNLGYSYVNGQGVRKDKAEAVKWFRKAAEQNYAPAQSNLGYCYDNGRGVEQDRVEAYAWFSMAAKADSDAAESRDLLRKVLTPQQFTDAQKRMKALRSQIKATPISTLKSPR